MSDFIADEHVYSFFDTVFYVCEDAEEPESTRKFYFDDDYNRVNMSMTCMESGNWTAYPNITCINVKGTYCSYSCNSISITEALLLPKYKCLIYLHHLL